jgi:transposase
MSKARLVITAVVTEGRSQADVARDYGVSKGWVSKLVARYRAEGETAFEPHSRRPKTSPTAIGQTTVDLIIRLRAELTGKGVDAGPDTIAWHLREHHQITVSPRTIARKLTAAGVITPEPTSSCSSRTCTSASSTPPPANSYANSPGAQPSTTNPKTPKTAEPAGSTVSDVLTDHRVPTAGIEPAAFHLGGGRSIRLSYVGVPQA